MRKPPVFSFRSSLKSSTWRGIIDINLCLSFFFSLYFSLSSTESNEEEIQRNQFWEILIENDRSSSIRLRYLLLRIESAHHSIIAENLITGKCKEEFDQGEGKIIKELTSAEHWNAVFKRAPVRRVSRIWDTREAGSRGTQIRGRFVIASGRVRFLNCTD